MSVEAEATVIGAIIRAILTGLLALIPIFLQRGKKLITYEVTSMPLLRFKPLNDMLRISVDKSILSGNLGDKGIFEQITSAYGFEVKVLNVGNQDIEKPTIEIKIEKHAKIISYDIQPSSRPGYDIDVQTDANNLNIIRFIIPFINKKETITVRLISTGNLNKEYKVNVLGLGIKCKKFFDSTIFLPFLILIPAIFILILEYMPSNILLEMGGVYSQRRVVAPIWIDYTAMLCLIVVGAIVIISLIKRVIVRLNKSEVEWDDTTSNNSIENTIKNLFINFKSNN